MCPSVVRTDPALSIDHQVLEGAEDSVPAGVDGLTQRLGTLVGDLSRRMEPVRAVEHMPDDEGLVKQDVGLDYLVLLDSELDRG